MDAADQSDQRLVEAAKTGDDHAFTELVRRHKARILALCSRFARSSADLDDLAQDVFIRAWQRLHQFRGDAPFEHWLARIATLASYDYLRRQRAPTLPLESAEWPATSPSPGTGREAAEVLHYALSRLKPGERLVITLLELDEKSVREVAELTGWSEANVKVRAFRARQELKRELERINHER